MLETTHGNNGDQNNPDETAQPVAEPQDAVQEASQMDKGSPKEVTVSGDLSMTQSFAMSINVGKDAQVSTSFTNAIVAGNNTQIADSISGAMVAGSNIEVTDSLAGAMVAGGDVTMNNGRVLSSTIGGNLNASNTMVGIVFAQQTNLSDNSRILLNTPQAIAFGAALGAALGMVSWLLWRKR